MKFSEEAPAINALPKILEIFEEKQPQYLNELQFQRVNIALHDVGIFCDNREEVLECIKLLGEMSILEVREINTPKGVMIMVGNLYNGK